MNGSRWDAFRELHSLQDRMNRLFEEASRGNAGRDGSPGPNGWNPSVDVFESDAAIVMTAELPGLRREDIHLDLEENTLTLSGTRESVRATGEDRYHRIERSYGSFSRSFAVAAFVAAEDVQADYKNGVLTVVLTKTRQTDARQIPIGT